MVASAVVRHVELDGGRQTGPNRHGTAERLGSSIGKSGDTAPVDRQRNRTARTDEPSAGRRPLDGRRASPADLHRRADERDEQRRGDGGKPPLAVLRADERGRESHRHHSHASAGRTHLFDGHRFEGVRHEGLGWVAAVGPNPMG